MAASRKSIEKYNKAKEYYIANNVSLRECRKEFGVDPDKFSKFLKKNSIPVREIDIAFARNKNPECNQKNQDISNAVNYYQEHDISIKDCANMFKINRLTLGQHLNAFGIFGSVRKNFLNEKFFEIIETEEQAYWLGFLLADGCISTNCNSIRLRLMPEDTDHLVKFKNALNFTGNLKYEENKAFKPGKQYPGITICSKKMKNDLICKGFTADKSHDAVPYEGIPDSLQLHYIRGIFDGDGWISFKKQNEIGIGGTFSVCNYIKSRLEKSCGIELQAVKEYSNIYRFRAHAKADIVDILEAMYGSSTVYLDRKFSLAKNFCRF